MAFNLVPSLYQCRAFVARPNIDPRTSKAASAADKEFLYAHCVHYGLIPSGDSDARQPSAFPVRGAARQSLGRGGEDERDARRMQELTSRIRKPSSRETEAAPNREFTSFDDAAAVKDERDRIALASLRKKMEREREFATDFAAGKSPLHINSYNGATASDKATANYLRHVRGSGKTTERSMPYEDNYSEYSDELDEDPKAEKSYDAKAVVKKKKSAQPLRVKDPVKGRLAAAEFISGIAQEQCAPLWTKGAPNDPDLLIECQMGAVEVKSLPSVLMDNYALLLDAPTLTKGLQQIRNAAIRMKLAKSPVVDVFTFLGRFVVDDGKKLGIPEKAVRFFEGMYDSFVLKYGKVTNMQSYEIGAQDRFHEVPTGKEWSYETEQPPNLETQEGYYWVTVNPTFDIDKANYEKDRVTDRSIRNRIFVPPTPYLTVTEYFARMSLIAGPMVQVMLKSHMKALPLVYWEPSNLTDSEKRDYMPSRNELN